MLIALANTKSCQAYSATRRRVCNGFCLSRGGAKEIHRHGVELLLKCSTTANGEGVLVMDEIGARKEGTEAARVGR